MICLVLMVAFILAAVTDQAGAVLSNEDFLPRQQAARAPGQQAIVYSVEAGDSLWAIAQRFHVNINVLMTQNGLDENSLLKIGRQITIPGSGYRVHRIGAGETLWDIARASGTSVEQLQSLNPGIEPNNLCIGEVLNLPGGPGGSALAMNQISRGMGYRVILNWPIIGKITSYFGWRKLGFHYGLDIAGKTGDPIRAAAAGVVQYAGWKGNYGKAVIIEHQDGRQTLYGHMQRTLVQPGESIARGDIIGRVGSTGHSTGPHLHFEVREEGACCNPLKFLR